MSEGNIEASFCATLIQPWQLVLGAFFSPNFRALKGVDDDDKAEAMAMISQKLATVFASQEDSEEQSAAAKEKVRFWNKQKKQKHS